jgi:hypothetical protein
MAVPTFDEWLRLSESERERVVDQLSGYDGVGDDLIGQVANRFREEFGHLPGISIDGPGIPHGGGWAIGVTHDVIFDRRWSPGEAGYSVTAAKGVRESAVSDGLCLVTPKLRKIR